MKNKHQQQVVTTEFRILKRNILADMIQDNAILKDIPENTLLQKVKEIESTIFANHAANMHLYNSKLEKIINLMKNINNHKMNHIAQEIQSNQFSLEYFTTLIAQRKELAALEKKLSSKSVVIYDPLKVKQKVDKILVADKITIVQPKKQMASFHFHHYNEPQKKVKLELKKNEDDDEEIIRVKDGMQGATSLSVYYCQTMLINDKDMSIPVVLLSESNPRGACFCDKIDVKLFPAEQTIQYLQINLERKIIFGQLQMRYIDSSIEKLYTLGMKMLQENKLIAQKYDNDNSTILIMHKQQLLQILKVRKEVLNVDSTQIIIKEWANQQYLEAFARNLNSQNHLLYFLVHYKKEKEHYSKSLKLTIQKQSLYPEIQNYVQEYNKVKDVELLLNGFLNVDLENVQENKITEPAEIVQTQNSTQKMEEIQIQIPEPLEVEKPLDFDFNIRGLALQLQQEDYF